MKIRWTIVGVIILAALTGLQAFPAKQPASERSTSGVREGQTPVTDEEKIVGESVKAYLNARNARNAKAIGELFTADAEYYDEFGEKTVGREAIVQSYQAIFDSDDTSIEDIQVQRVRRIDQNVLLEEGVSISSDGVSPKTLTRYIALHNRGADGKWRIGTLKEVAQRDGDRTDQLAQLSWMLGEWVNQDRESVVHTECEWSADQNYLLRNFVVETRNSGELRGVQRIGWDASIKKIRSWTFDSEGGFLEGIWTRDGARWFVASKGVNAQGETVSGTAVYTVVDEEMIIWQYRDLIVDNEVRGDTEAVTMVRHPPEPKTESN